jgi:hypothetical protein
MIEISHLVVNGCSFTVCQGLEDPCQQGWPALLAKRLGVPVVNLAIGGSGNDGITRRTYEYFYKNKNLGSKPFYINVFSHATRREEFFKQYKGQDINDFWGLNLNACSLDLLGSLKEEFRAEDYEVAHIMNLSFEACERKKILNWVSCINLFKANNIPYLTADFMPTKDDAVISYMENHYTEIYNTAIKDENYVGKLPELTKHLPKLPCQHETLEAMPILANAMYDKIMSVYKNISIVHSDDYMRCKDFYNEQTRDLLSFNPWVLHS